MRHRNKINALSRASDHRKALIHNLMKDLFEHGSIMTTLPKAKAVRPYVKRLSRKEKAARWPPEDTCTHSSRIRNSATKSSMRFPNCICIARGGTHGY